MNFIRDLIQEVLDRVDTSDHANVIDYSKDIDNAIACFLEDMDEMAMHDSDGPDLYPGVPTPEMNRAVYESALRILRPHLLVIHAIQCADEINEIRIGLQSIYKTPNRN